MSGQQEFLFELMRPSSFDETQVQLFYGPDEQLYLRFIETGWTPELEQRLLLPRHALHSAKLAIKDEREWTSALPPDLAEFCR